MTQPFSTRENDFGLLTGPPDDAQLRFSRHLTGSPAQLWPALTEEARLSPWFPTTIEGEFIDGAPLRFSFRDMDIDSFDGEMLECNSPARMKFRWAGDILHFDLASLGHAAHQGDVDDITVLTLAVTLEHFGKAARDGAGWHTSLDLLECHVRGTDPPWSAADRWREIHPWYVKQFGPEASAIGPPQAWEEVNGPPSETATER